MREFTAPLNQVAQLHHSLASIESASKFDWHSANDDFICFKRATFPIVWWDVRSKHIKVHKVKVPIEFRGTFQPWPAYVNSYVAVNSHNRGGLLRGRELFRLTSRKTDA